MLRSAPSGISAPGGRGGHGAPRFCGVRAEERHLSSHRGLRRHPTGQAGIGARTRRSKRKCGCRTPVVSARCEPSITRALTRRKLGRGERSHATQPRTARIVIEPDADTLSPVSLTIGPTENLEEASRALAPSLGPGHHAEFYDDAAYPALAIAAYLAEALRAGGAAVAIAADLHLSELRSALVASDVDVAGEVDRGRLLLLDGDETLAALCRDGEPDDGAFEDVIGRLVRSLAGRFGNVRAFGEMVDILCRSGRASSALALEGLWNHLRASVPFDLLCAYGLTSFERAGAEPDFTRVCDAHGRVRISSADESAGLDPARLTAHLEQRRRALDYEAGRRAQLEAEQLRHASAEKHLAAVTRLLSSSLEYDETVGRVAELAVPAFGDWCAVDLLSDDYRVCSRVSVARRSAAEIGRAHV